MNSELMQWLKNQIEEAYINKRYADSEEEYGRHEGRADAFSDVIQWLLDIEGK